MTGGILRDLAIAAEARAESSKQLIQACRRLAKRIAETGRVGDRAVVNGRVYRIENAAWTLMDKDGKTYESFPPVKTLVVHTGSWYEEDGVVSDDRRIASLLQLTPTGTDPVDHGPHYAKLEALLEADYKGAYDLEGVGPTEFEPASSIDYDRFTADAEEIVAGFIECLRDDVARDKKGLDKLDSLSIL